MSERRPDVLKAPLIDRHRIDKCLRMVEIALSRGNREECESAIADCFADETIGRIDLDSPLAEVGLDTRLVNTLESQRMMYVGDLVKRRRSHLLAIPNIGSKQLKLIVEALAEHGLRLREEA